MNNPTTTPTNAVTTFSGALGDNASLTKTGAGTLVLSGTNNYGGATTISAGSTLQLGNGGPQQSANPNLAVGRIILGNELQFGGQGNYNLGGLSGSGSVALGNTFTGNLILGGGTLQLGNSSALGAGAVSSDSIVDNGALVFSATGTAAAQQPSDRRGTVRDDQQRELAEYQQKLAKDNGPLQFQGKAGDQAPVKHKDDMTVSGEVVSLNNTGLIVANVGFAAAPTAPAGLASLDFELPADKDLYELYRFTTPRGEAELTARTVSNGTLARLEGLLGIVAAGLLVWAGFWLVRRGVLGWFRRPLGAIFLFLVGLVSLCSQVLPFVGLIALLAGIVLLVAALLPRAKAAA